MGLKIEIEMTDAIIDRIADRVIERCKTSPIPIEEKEEKTYYVKEISEKIGVSKEMLYRHINIGLLKTHKRGGKHIITQTNFNIYNNGNNS